MNRMEILEIGLIILGVLSVDLSNSAIDGSDISIAISWFNVFKFARFSLFTIT